MGFLLISATLIAYNGIQNLYLDLIEKIHQMENDVQGVMGIEKCLVRKTCVYFFVDIHLEVDGTISVEKGHKIGHDFKGFVMYKIPEISDVLVHIEPVIVKSIIK